MNGRELEATDREALGGILEALAEREAKICEALYPVFFARRPDVVPLFGVHALAEREEMVRETFRSLLALAEGEGAVEGDAGGGHLAANLAALGRSHWEYGVTGEMYPDFVEAFVDVAAGDLDAPGRGVLARALGRITQAMRRAGDEVAAQRSR